MPTASQNYYLPENNGMLTRSGLRKLTSHQFQLLGYLIINTKSDGTPLFILHITVMIQQKNSYW